MADPDPPGPPPGGLCGEIDPTTTTSPSASPQWCCQWEGCSTMAGAVRVRAPIENALGDYAPPQGII